MRLLPRWVRASVILLSLECNLSLVVLGFQIYQNKANADQDNSLKYLYYSYITLFSSSLSYAILYVTTRFISISVGKIIQNSKGSQDIIKKL